MTSAGRSVGGTNSQVGIWVGLGISRRVDHNFMSNIAPNIPHTILLTILLTINPLSQRSVVCHGCALHC